MAAGDKRVSRSIRTWIDADGNKVDPKDAVGARYQVKDDKGAVVDTVDFFPQTQDRGTMMAAIFGFQTRAGNELNSVVNDKSGEGTFKMAAEAVREFADGLVKGNWPEREGGVGARVDLDKLTQAACAYFRGELDQKPPKLIPDIDPARVLEKVTDDAKTRTSLRAIPAVATEYRRLTVGEVDEAALLESLVG